MKQLISKENQRKRKEQKAIERTIYRALLIIGVPLLYTISYKLGIPVRHDPISILLEWGELLIKLPLLIIAVVIVAFSFIKEHTTYRMICTFCETEKLDDGESSCECGGVFYNVELVE
jgi:hypothetical protein